MQENISEMLMHNNIMTARIDERTKKIEDAIFGTENDPGILSRLHTVESAKTKLEAHLSFFKWATGGLSLAGVATFFSQYFHKIT
jgi:hypothetical protein